MVDDVWTDGVVFCSNNGEGFIAEKDYLYLLNYLEEYMPLPKQLYAAFEECMIPMAGLLSNSQFVTWVRQYPDVMEVRGIFFIVLLCCALPCLTEECVNAIVSCYSSPSIAPAREPDWLDSHE